MHKKSLNLKTTLTAAVVLVLIVITVLLSGYMGDRNYYIAGVIIIILTLIPFFVRFEGRKPQPREMVTIAVMTAIAVVSRIAFIMVPAFKPMLGIVMITGVALGPMAGFMTGCFGAFVSNFVFGQGPWTPWQMLAFGLAGFIAALLARGGVMKFDTWKRSLMSAIIGGVMILIIIGPLLDTCTFFIASSGMSGTSATAVYLAGVPVNAIHGLCVALTLLLAGKPIKDKLDRIRVKYGIMEDEGQS